MKIQKVSSTGSKNNSVKSKSESPSSSFLNLMNDKRDSEKRKELDKMMENIKEKGEELVDSKNVELLVLYKKNVKQFVESAVGFAFEIVDRKGRSRIGRSKILKLISQIDDELIKLTDEFLSKERNKLNLLDQIGELSGLLTNIYV